MSMIPWLNSKSRQCYDPSVDRNITTNDQGGSFCSIGGNVQDQVNPKDIARIAWLRKVKKKKKINFSLKLQRCSHLNQALSRVQCHNFFPFHNKNWDIKGRSPSVEAALFYCLSEDSSTRPYLLFPGVHLIHGISFLAFIEIKLFL